MENNTLTHHGILGQKWGVRRYQNKDGSLTEAGKKHQYQVEFTDPDGKRNIATFPGMKRKAAEAHYNNLIEKQKQQKIDGKIKLIDLPEEKIRNQKAGFKSDGVVDDRKQASQNRRNLSDAELKKRIERLQTEKRLKDLTEADLSPGKAAVKEVLANSGKKVATAVVTGATLYAIKSAMTGKFDLSEAASYMTPKPKK